MEHEITDPANLYFLPGSNVYNPRLQIDLSQVGPQGLAGPSAGVSARASGYSPGGSSGGLSVQGGIQDAQQGVAVGEDTSQGIAYAAAAIDFDSLKWPTSML